MRKNIIILTAVLPLLMSACSETRTEETEVKTPEVKVEENKTNVNVTTKNTTVTDENKETTVTNKVNVTQKESSNLVSKVLEVKHAFSDPVQKDNFKITLTGKTILDANVVFNITSYKGVKIYEDKFESNFLVGYSDTTLTKQEQEKRIIDRFNNFFNEKYFYIPAITNQTLDTYIISQQAWNDIKNDKSSIGFAYTIGKENTKFIAYHKKSGKAVMYFNCC